MDNRILALAFSIKIKPEEDPVLGVVSYLATMETNRDTRMMKLVSLTINDIRLPGLANST